jgi:hypothetical protein
VVPLRDLGPEHGDLVKIAPSNPQRDGNNADPNQ